MAQELKLSVVKESQFSNTYGGLCLAIGDDGSHYLVMEDCMGPDAMGPMTAEEVCAFHELCGVAKMDFMQRYSIEYGERG